MKKRTAILWVPLILIVLCMPGIAYHHRLSSNTEMSNLLKTIQTSETVLENPLAPEAGLAFYDSVIRFSNDAQLKSQAELYKAADYGNGGQHRPGY